MHEVHGHALPIPHLAPPTGIMSQLKDMRENMASMFKTDFGSAVPEPPTVAALTETQASNFRKMLTPLDENHTLEDEAASKEQMDI